MQTAWFEVTTLILFRLGRRIVTSDSSWWVMGIVAVLVTGGILSWCFWDELGNENESVSTTIRNVGLLVGGVAAVLIAVWRSIVAERQTTTSQQGLLNERYQKGAEMLGSKVLSVRLGGIYALEQLAAEQPQYYHLKIVKLFCAFMRHPVKDKSRQSKEDEEEKPGHNIPRPHEDVQAVMEAIRARSKAGIQLERKHCLKLDLSSADLRSVQLMGADLSHSILTGADLSKARLDDVNFSNASLDKANLSGARLGGANLSDAALWSTNLTGTFLVLAPSDHEDESAWQPAVGLTQKSLDWACADKPPALLGRVLDAGTGRPLEWRGRLCNEGS